MKRKFLPLFLTCALVLSSSMAFAADVNEPVEGDALTVVSEEQEEAAVEEETQEEVVTGEAKENVSVAYSDDETNEPDNGTNNSDVVYDFGKAYAALGTNGNPVSGSDTVKAIGNDSIVVMDVRSTVNYEKAHLDGSINVPVFDANGNVIYTILLNADHASDLFSDRYDTYGLKQYDDYHVTSNKIVDTFDKDGYFISETTEFNASVSSSGQKVSIKYTSSVNYLKLNNTSVSISKDQKKEMKEYVYFEDIDTSSLSSDSQYDDTAEKTVTDTFKKRLVNRLGYEKANDGSYQQSFNENEAYIIDFKNYTFTYTKYSIRYTYNWKGDISTMGSCTVNYQKDKQSSSCKDSTVEMMKTVKQYFEMELYYCGLSLDDLQKEAK